MDENEAWRLRRIIAQDQWEALEARYKGPSTFLVERIWWHRVWVTGYVDGWDDVSDD
jgi:hypothetical protein